MPGHLYLCACGERFPATLEGAWLAKLHAEEEGHRLRGLRPRRAELPSFPSMEPAA